MTQVKEKENKTLETLKDKFGYSNPLQAPRLVKVVVNVGIGSVQSKEKLELIEDRLSTITGQKVAKCSASKSIASFKIREGDIIGYRVTMRGKRMYDFLEKLFHIALPRTKDFKGISRDSIDDMGNMTIGISDHTIFPETPDEELKNIFGFSVTMVTTSSEKEESESFLEHIGVPFKKREEQTNS
ncbi:MAG: 50S ribosomal protein L5 [Patescibacteria group bacterium]